MAITIDHIHGEWIGLHTGHDLNVKLVPAGRGEVGTVPVREEGADGSHAVWCLHTCHKFTISEVLVGAD